MSEAASQPVDGEITLIFQPSLLDYAAVQMLNRKN